MARGSGVAHRVTTTRQSGAEPERRGKASKPETMRPFTRWKSSGERSQSVHSTEALPMQDGREEEDEKAKPVRGKGTQEFRWDRRTHGAEFNSLTRKTGLGNLKMSSAGIRPATRCGRRR